MVPTVWNEDADSMNQYSETFLDHYRRPRNLGDLVDSDAVAIVHNKVCGDVLRIAIAVEPVLKRSVAGSLPSASKRMAAPPRLLSLR